MCDQSGECELQNFYMNFGLYDPRFREQKVKKKMAVAVGPLAGRCRTPERRWNQSLGKLHPIATTYGGGGTEGRGG